MIDNATLEKFRLVLVREVQAICTFWDASAQQAALEFARCPNNKQKADDARIAVARADGVAHVKDRIIGAINGNFAQMENDHA